MYTNQFRSCNLFDGLLLIGTRVDGTIIGDGVDFCVILTNFSDSVRGSILDFINQFCNDIEEDDLLGKLVMRCECWRWRTCLISGQVELLGDEPTTNHTTPEVDGLWSHIAIAGDDQLSEEYPELSSCDNEGGSERSGSLVSISGALTALLGDVHGCESGGWLR